MTRFTMIRLALLACCVACAGCSHLQLSGSDLDRVSRPAFIGRIEEGAGPKSLVFREDSTYAARLNRLDPKEADRRLQAKLAQAVSRFEVSDRLRAVVFAQLPKEPPWSNTIDPVKVGGVLESFLVEEVPANPPDYDLLRTLGADAIVEFVIEHYGLRSAGGRCGVFVSGYGRMFRLGGSNLWRSPFEVDRSRGGSGALDPFQVAQGPEIYRRELSSALDDVAREFAKELNPSDRHLRATALPKAAEQSPPDDVNRTGRPDTETKEQ